MATVTEQGLDLGHILCCLLTVEMVSAHVQSDCAVPRSWQGSGHPSGEESGEPVRYAWTVHAWGGQWLDPTEQELTEGRVNQRESTESRYLQGNEDGHSQPTWHRTAPTGNSTLTAAIPTATLTQQHLHNHEQHNWSHPASPLRLIWCEGCMSGPCIPGRTYPPSHTPLRLLQCGPGLCVCPYSETLPTWPSNPESLHILVSSSSLLASLGIDQVSMYMPSHPSTHTVMSPLTQQIARSRV